MLVARPKRFELLTPQIRSPGRAIEIIEVCYRKNRLPLESLRKSSQR
jgi:hypothetical protein